MATKDIIEDRFNQLLTTVQNMFGRDDAVSRDLKQKFDLASDDPQRSEELKQFLTNFLNALDQTKASSESSSTSESIKGLIKMLLEDMEKHKVPSTVPKNNSNGVSALDQEASTSNAGSLRQRRLKQIFVQKLEGAVYDLKKNIRKRELEELSIDDMDKERSAFTDLERLNKKLLKDYAMLSKYKDDVVIPPPLMASYKGSGAEGVDKAVTKLIQCTKKIGAKDKGSVSRSYKIPSFTDIKSTLGSSDQRSIATKIYDDVVRMIKRKDQQNILEHLSTYVESNELPEEQDEELASKLRKNDDEAKTAIFSLQETSKGQNGIIGDLTSALKIIDEGILTSGAETDVDDGDECSESDKSDEDDEGNEDVIEIVTDEEGIHASPHNASNTGTPKEDQTQNGATGCGKISKELTGNNVKNCMVSKGASKKAVKRPLVVCDDDVKTKPRKKEIEIIDLSDE